MGTTWRSLLGTGFALGMLAAPAWADDPPKKAEAKPADAKAGKDDAGNDPAALVRELKSARPDFAKAASRDEALVKFIGKMVPLADRITAHADASAEAKGEARQTKLFLLHMGAKQLKQKELVGQYDALCAAVLKDDPKSEMSGFVKGLTIIEKAGDGGAPPPAEVLAFAKEFPTHPFVGQLAMMAAQGMDGGDPEASKKFLKDMLAVLPPGPVVKRLDGMLKSLQILGTQMEIAGPTLAGKPFDVKDWKGKVVLVDFWATWCGPCIGEIPHMKKAYQRYHAKGFEIVGVSLDNSKKELEEFVAEQKLEWTQVFHQPKEGESGWANPLAEKYGITGIPAMFLLDKEGKVISKSLRGPNALEKKLAELLGPAPAEAAQKEATAEKPAPKDEKK